MSPSKETPPITKANLDIYLKDLAKEYRRLTGKEMPAEIILTGGAAVLAEYGFRELTYDVDAIIVAASTMKDAVSRARDKHNLPHGWLNTDFKQTASYSDKLREVSVYYKTFSNILTIRTITAEYLLAMKLMSGRRYKNDLSDIVGILREHQKKNDPISREAVETAIISLYGKGATIPETSKQLLNAVFSVGDYETLYRRVRDSETEARDLLLAFDSKYPDQLKSENIDSVLDSAKMNHRTGQKKTLINRLEEKKRIVAAENRFADSPNPSRRKGLPEIE